MNTTGNNTTANGYNSLYQNTGANYVGVEYRAEWFAATGTDNIESGHIGLAAHRTLNGGAPGHSSEGSPAARCPYHNKLQFTRQR